MIVEIRPHKLKLLNFHNFLNTSRFFQGLLLAALKMLSIESVVIHTAFVLLRVDLAKIFCISKPFIISPATVHVVLLLSKFLRSIQDHNVKFPIVFQISILHVHPSDFVYLWLKVQVYSVYNYSQNLIQIFH